MDPDPQSVPHALGEFRISAVLGQGGSGIVYDATWGPRRVALKVLHHALTGTGRIRSQFLSEAKVLQAITHPSVVKVLAVGELPDTRPYLAMERLEGETLAAVLARGPLELAHALALFDELCDAVGALHAQGLVHRDLKPENVFIVAGEHAVLLDFGIAKELDAPDSTTTIDGGVRGTPAYMAPERFFGQPAGVTTDVYELAVTLYAMLAGRLPWDDLADPEARLSPRPLVELAPGVPPELDIEVRRALSTRAQNRPASAKVFREAVESVHVASGHAGLAPTAAETARMRPAPSPTVEGGPPAISEGKPPWFAERHSTTDRGRTPLAWAPTESPAALPPPPPRRRWPFVVGGIAVAAMAGGVAWWRIAGDEPARPSARPDDGLVAVAHDALSAADDPWGATPPPPPRSERVEIQVTGDRLPAAVAQKEIAAAIASVPADTRVLFTANVGELRGNAQFDAILGKLAAHPRLSLMLNVAPCVKPILSGSEWVVFAAKSLEDGDRATLIVRGHWQRTEIERCFADDMVKLEMPDGATMLQLRRVGWVDFLDDHTVYLSVREDLAAAQVHALVKAGKGPTTQARRLLARVPADRTVAAIVDASGKLPWPEALLPPGSDLVTWMRVEDAAADLAVTVDVKDETAALRLVERVRNELDPVFKDADPKAVGKIEVVRAKTEMQLRARLTALMIGMISAAVP